MLNMSDEQLGKMAKDQENFQLESQRMIPPLVYPRSVPMIPLPIPFVQNPCQNPLHVNHSNEFRGKFGPSSSEKMRKKGNKKRKRKADIIVNKNIKIQSLENEEAKIALRMLAAIKRKQKVLQENLKSKDLEIKALKKSNADLEDKQKDKQFDIKAALALKDIEIDELRETTAKWVGLQEKLKSKDCEIKDLKKSIVSAKSKIVAVLASKGSEIKAKDIEINAKNIELRSKDFEIQVLKNLQTLVAFKDSEIKAKDIEINNKDSEIKELRDTNAKFENLRELLAGRVFHSDPRNKSLKSLLTLEIDRLYLEYDHVTKDTKKSDEQKKIEDLAETLADVKTKLNLQMEQRQIYEKEHEEMFKVLNIPSGGNRNFTDILRTINVLVEQSETDKYAHAESVLDSYSRKEDRSDL